jgi:hypothetical protein
MASEFLINHFGSPCYLWRSFGDVARGESAESGGPGFHPHCINREISKISDTSKLHQQVKLESLLRLSLGHTSVSTFVSWEKKKAL